MAGSPLKNLRMFKELCGKNALQNIILTTTMWDEVDESTGVMREKELKAKYWKAMIDQGSRTVRYFNTPESAWNIVDHFVETANNRYAILLQQEMVDMELELRETSAGQMLFGTLEVLVKKQQEMLLKIRVETKYHADESVLAALKDESEDLRKQIEVIVREMETLKISLGKRFLRLLRLRFKGKAQRWYVACLVHLRSGLIPGHLDDMLRGACFGRKWVWWLPDADCRLLLLRHHFVLVLGMSMESRYLWRIPSSSASTQPNGPGETFSNIRSRTDWAVSYSSPCVCFRQRSIDGVLHPQISV
jgi:hypothetical protein